MYIPKARLDGYEVAASKPSTIPSLATLVQLLIDSCRQYLVCLEFHNMFSGKSKENLHELSHREIKELSIPEKLLKSSQQKDCIIINRIATLLEMKSKELRLLTFIIENGLFLLWTHMEFYLVNGRSARSDISHLHFFKGSNETKTSDGFLMDAGLSEEDITIFKKESVTWMNEIFFESLLKVYKNQRKDSSSSGFIPALVRRLRRIITFYACKN
ncbi:hypothetical protein HELRODRAFT_187837 [Helobdella robusta]|uniref:Uncharacterized protein n=1 Tax=Helobdella robusta TaxID=6412 RepID=T1FPF1_HELRO|nr:hypothetical protein HELRODRAFT_187837 [Helobdella robusta]ESO12328.1 hypothetical protein HELRODRAFT_187837 [Helobdella robusta]